MNEHDEQIEQDEHPYAKRIMALLGPFSPPMEFKKAKLYLVNEATLNELLHLKEQIEEETAELPKRQRGFYPVANIVSQEAVVHYTVSYKRFYQSFKDVEKIHKELDGRFAVWKNKTLKDADALAKAQDTTPERAAELRKEAEREVKRGEEQYERIKGLYKGPEEGFGDYDVRITNYDPSENGERQFKAYVTMTNERKESLQSYLRDEVPNIMYYEAAKPNLNPTEKFLQRAENAFGNVYIALKEEESEE